jgi:hypothetical protein
LVPDTNGVRVETILRLFSQEQFPTGSERVMLESVGSEGHSRDLDNQDACVS